MKTDQFISAWFDRHHFIGDGRLGLLGNALDSRLQKRVQEDPRGPGGPPHFPTASGSITHEVIRVFRVLVPASVLALFLFDVLLIFACYAAVTYVELDGDLYLFSLSGWQPIAIAEGLILLGMYFRHLYEDLRIPSRTMLLQQLSLIFGLTFIAEALMTYWNVDWALPRDILIPGSALALAAVFLCRILFSLGSRNKVGARRVLFVGFSPTAVKLAGYLGGHPEFGLTPIGYLGLPQAEEQPGAGLARLGPAANLPGIVDQFRPDWIVVAEQEEIQPRWVDDFLDLRFGGVHTEPAPSSTRPRSGASALRRSGPAS